jgi:hypothetical protein
MSNGSNVTPNTSIPKNWQISANKVSENIIPALTYHFRKTGIVASFKDSRKYAPKGRIRSEK